MESHYLFKQCITDFMPRATDVISPDSGDQFKLSEQVKQWVVFILLFLLALTDLLWVKENILHRCN